MADNNTIRPTGETTLEGNIRRFSLRWVVIRAALIVFALVYFFSNEALSDPGPLGWGAEEVRGHAPPIEGAISLLSG
jgi:hypothetical protein